MHMDALTESVVYDLIDIITENSTTSLNESIFEKYTYHKYKKEIDKLYNGELEDLDPSDQKEVAKWMETSSKMLEEMAVDSKRDTGRLRKVWNKDTVTSLVSAGIGFLSYIIGGTAYAITGSGVAAALGIIGLIGALIVSIILSFKVYNDTEYINKQFNYLKGAKRKLVKIQSKTKDKKIKAKIESIIDKIESVEDEYSQTVRGV